MGIIPLAEWLLSPRVPVRWPSTLNHVDAVLLRRGEEKILVPRAIWAPACPGWLQFQPPDGQRTCNLAIRTLEFSVIERGALPMGGSLSMEGDELRAEQMTNPYCHSLRWHSIESGTATRRSWSTIDL